MPGLDYAPVAFTTAKDAKNIQSVMDLATQLFKQASQRVSTGELNQIVKQMIDENAPRPKPWPAGGQGPLCDPGLRPPPDHRHLRQRPRPGLGRL